jgi:hypothetical protein
MQRDRTLGAKAHDLTARVNPGIGARRTGHGHLVGKQLAERRFQVALHGRTIGLALPAAQTCAVVFDEQTDVPHDFLYLRRT